MFNFSPAFDMVVFSRLPEQRTFCSSKTPHAPVFLTTSMAIPSQYLAGIPSSSLMLLQPPAQCLALFSMYIHPLGDYMLNNGLRCYLYAPNPSRSLILTYPASYLISLSEYLTGTSNLTCQIHASWLPREFRLLDTEEMLSYSHFTAPTLTAPQSCFPRTELAKYRKWSLTRGKVLSYKKCGCYMCVEKWPRNSTCFND